MTMTLAVHVLAGTLGLIAGFVALYSAKGAIAHRRSGTLFVYAMLVMCVGGLTIAAVRNVAPEINVPAALLTSYLVITALTTVSSSRLSALGARPVSVGLMIVALGVGTTMLAMGVEAIASGGRRNGMPAFPFFMFGTIGMLGSVGDFRVIRTGALTGKRRLARHLWRMNIALFIATLSFSVQAMKIVAREGLRVPAIFFAVPMLLVLVTMAFWLWRVRRKGVNVERWTHASSTSPSLPASSAAIGRA